ncbi:EamA family transporter [Conexibacter sp. W3-3-2]|uniref:EamA family transporter n=1 Tax=Conexibacter sp. W3-3-2 TaxID=2675227 RepID=UPI00132604EC|nr:DMT family transporter [Conexibacter sp. W3-3-2]MTD46485.1 EamA family transporter [Conexibacter sp. W3-3-2]
MSAPHDSPFDRVPPVTLVLFAVSSIQFGAALAATVFDEIGPGGTSFLRLGLAALIMAVIWRPDPRRHSREELRLVLVLGLMLGGMNYSFYEALDRIPLGIAVTIEFLGPLGVAVRTSRRRLDLVWAAVAGAGIVLLARPGGDGIDPVGLVLVLIAAACWAAYILAARRAGELFGGARGLAMAMGVAFLVPLVPGLHQGGTQLLEPGFLLIGLGVAVLSSVIPYTLETEALRRIPTNVFGVLMSLEPAVAALAGFLVLDQALDAVELSAIALVVAASIGVTRTRAVPMVAEG